MDSLLNAIHLNNEGARLLGSGDALGSLHLIWQGVVAMKDCLLDDRAASSTSFARRQERPISSFHAGERGCVSRVGAFHVYSRPLLVRIHNASIPATQTHGQICNLVSTYLIFNLALACHRYGIETGTQVSLDRAMDLYHIILESDSSTRPESSTNGDGCLNRSLLQYLVLNNLAHLHYEKCDYDCCKWCLACMENVAVTTACLDGCESILGIHEAEEVQLNLLFVQAPLAAHAA